VEAILLHRDADDNARVAALSVKNSRRFDALNPAVVTVVRVVVPTGAIVEECLPYLLARVVEVTNYGICQGATGA
jgi:hypothetical protein